MGKRRYQRAHRPAPDFRLETLESRLLFSADAALLAADTGPHEAANVAVITSDVEISSDVNTEGAESGSNAKPTDSNELIVVDAAAPDLDALLADFSVRHDKPRVVLLEAGGDVLQQLGTLLGESKDLSAVHLFSHGSDGELELGGQRITTLDLLARANEISGWRGAFADGADFLIYGCDVASSADGRVFVDTLARLTQTDVAASTNLTGSAERGGDWQLEYARGEITTNVAASDQLQMSYDGTLATYVVTDYGDTGTNTLRWAIEQVNSGSGSDIITFSGAGGTISLASELPAIVRSVEIDATVGNDYINQPIVTIDGSSGLGTGLRFEAGSDNSTVRGLAIINMPTHGISLDGVTGVTIELNYIGNDGTTDQGNGGDGIHVSGSAQSNNIGGANTGNVISGNGQSGVHVTGNGTDGNSILGNTIGLNATGTAAIQNDGKGILIRSDAKNTIVGSSLAGAGNVVSGNADDGIDLRGSGVTGTVVQGNIVGLYADGLTRFANSNEDGIQIFDGANNNLIGGDAAAGEGNVVSGNGNIGVYILTGSYQNRVMGNIIGLDKDGVNDLGNDREGIRITDSADENIIGGSNEGDGNIVSGNGDYGIEIDDVADTQVLGNFIGTTSDGISARANDAGGLVVRGGAARTLIGGSGNHEMNLISGNSNHGIDVDGSGVLDTVIQGNRLGTELTGSSAIANSATGILVRNGAVGTIIGGNADLGEGNQISGNNSHGVHASAVGSGTVIQGNVIGLASDGFTALGNTGSGVYSENSDITIGGISNGAGNVISSNGDPFSPSTGAGVWLFQSNGSDVIGNIIGLDVDGRVGLGNEGYGISIINTDNSVVGAIGFGNTVSANESGGISVSDSDGTVIVANRIGTGLNINNAVGNNGAGVVFSGNSSSNTVGGTSTNQGNIIRANSAAGIAVTGSASTGNALLLNSIAANGGLGIDLGATGPLTNDSNDADPGANNLQNYPVLTSALSDHTGAVQIQGSIASEASQDYRVDYYASVTQDPSTQGEAERYLGTSFHTTDVSGVATINESLASVTLTDGEFVSATMTSLDGGGVPQSTSEFSVNVSADAQLNLSITNPVTVQGTQNTVLVFEGSNVIQVSDGLAADTPLQVALSVANGTLRLNTVNGIVFVAGADNSASMVIVGTESAINTALNKLEFTPALNYTGSETLTVSVALDNELQGYYTFETDSLDQSAGTAYNGTLQNGAVIVNDTQRGNVLSLDGVDDYVTIPSFFGNPADVSLAAWVNLSAADTGGSELITLGNNVILRLDDPSGGVIAAFYDGSAFQFINNNTFIAGTGWRHVAFTFDDTSKTARLFIDGAQVASSTMTGGISYAFGTETRIGRHGTAETNRDFNGLIDDTRIYTRALSNAEIKALSADEYVATTAVSMTVAPPNNRSPVFHGPGVPAFTSFDVSTAIGSARAVATADIDGDGDLDVLSASYNDDRIAWHENDGSGVFNLHTITTSADGARDVSSADIDGDGDLDVISASWTDDSIVWYENDGNGNFISHTIATNADWAISVTAADIDGDGHMDVLSASQNDDRLVWYRNDGNEVFSANVIATSANGPTSVTTADVDGDGDIDILSSSTYDDKIAWYENQGATVFPERIIATDADGARQVTTADVDGDGDLDVLSASFTDNEITWYENNGSQVFTSSAIATGFTGAYSVKAVDLDSDGDVDVVGAALNGHKVTWFENNGSESFTAYDIATDILSPYSVATGDLDGDGQIDVLTALSNETRVAWHKNTPVTLDGNPTYVESGAPVVLDVDVTVTDFELDALNGGSGNYSGATLTIVRNGTANSDDVLGFNDGSGLSLVAGSIIKSGQIVATFDTIGVAGQLTLSFTDAGGEIPTTADVSSALQQITYENNNDTPPASVQIDWTFDDGNSGSQGTGGALQSTGRTTVSITATNDAPVVTTDTGTLAYTENAGAVAVSPGLTVSDVDSTNLTGAVVQITGNYVNGEDELTFTTIGGISGSFVSGTGTLTLTGTATVAQYEAAIRTITYENISDNPSVATRTVSFTVNDADVDSTTQTRSIAITAVNDAPTVSTNILNISEGATVVLSATEVSATDVDTDDATLVFTASGVSGGQFENNTNAGVAITSFTQQQVTDGEVQFVHDGGEAAPAYSISVSDGSLSTIAAAATITFTNVNDVPSLSTNTLNISEGATVVLSATEVSATDIDTDDATLVFTASGISGGQFEVNTNAGVAITSFTQQQVTDGEVQFVHDGGEAAPAYSISVSDGSLSTIAAAATITFTNVNDVPLLSTNTLSISEGATVVLSATEVSATDIDTDDATLVFTASGISGGQFEVNTNAGVAITSFTQQQVTDGEVQFVHDGGEAAPAYSISVSDGSLSTIAAAATITFTNVNDVPSLSTNTLNISEGVTVVLSATEVSATDIDTDDATLVFTASGISGGQFEVNTNAGVAITSFTQQQVTDGEVQFVHDGGEAAPAYSISVSDGSLSTIAAAATITFTNVNDVPSLSTNTLNISEGATVVLSATEVSATDIDTDDATLVFTASNISGGQFENNTNAGVAITSFTQQQVTNGEVQFVHDGGEAAPAYSISVSDGSLSTIAAAATITFTNVNDVPSLSTNTLNISEGVTVVLSATEVSATDIDTDDATLVFTASGISGGQFENNTNAGVAITSFTQQQVTDGEVQFVHDGGEVAPAYSISVSDGSLSTAAAGATITFTNVNDGPTLSTNTLNISEGATVVLSATEVSATDIDTDDATLVFTASGISGGQFEVNTNAGVAITSFTQQQVTDGEVQFVHDGGEVAPAYSISVSDGSLSTAAAAATITFTNVNDVPLLSTNTLSISEGATVVLSATEVSATDIDTDDATLVFTASGISGGQFENNTNAGVAITSFTQQQVTDGEVLFVHDGGEAAPAYSISVSDGSLNTAAAGATITFTNVNDGPTLSTNTLNISEGATVVLSATEVSATDIDTDDATLVFTASGISGGQFEVNTNAGVAITSFTQQQVTDGEVQFVHDGGEAAPAYSISVSDGSLSTIAAAATITFTNVNDVPSLSTNTLNISEGVTVVLSATEVSATDIDTDDATLVFTASGISGGQFEVNTNAGVAITSFTQQQVTDGEVQFVHDGGEAAPAYSISVSDGSLSTIAAAATITFTNVNDVPLLSTNTLSISEGATVVLSATEVSATDIDTDDATLVFTASGISGGQFENNTNAGVAITSFTQQQVTDGEVQFVHDGGEVAPAYSISVSDGSLSTAAAAATITFTNVNDVPLLSTNTLSISEGATVVLSATEVSATDIDTDDATLVFTASGISGGQFENNTNAGVAITSFTQQQVTDGEVLFVHDGGEAAPAYSISVSDGSLSTAAAGATITFTNVNDGPTLSTNTLNISEGATVVLSATEVSATDIDTDDATLVFTASGISGGQFEVNTNAGVAITSFTQQQVTDGEVQFVHDGGEVAPAYSISVSDGSLSTAAAAATITFTNVNDVPLLSTNTLSISEGATVVLSATEVSATDIDTDDATLVFTASGISGGQFENNTNAGVAITSFTQQQVTDGEVLFVHDGGEAAPAYSISVSDGSLSTIAAAATITFTNVNDVPSLSTNTLNISEGVTVVLSATEVSATDIDTDDATLVFTASNISGGQFENNTNAGVAITSFTQQQVTDGEVQFVHDGGEAAPAYSISVSDGSLSTIAAAATITFTNVNDVPLLSTNTLSISEGVTVVLSATEVSATDIDTDDATLVFTASNISGGQFENNTNAGVAITSFTQQQVTDGEVQFVHDGGEVAPAYSISVSDGSLSTAAAGATITFTKVNDGSTLSTNTLSISEGATVVLSATEVSATDIDTDDATLVFTASNISGGQFENNTNAGVAITSFTQQQVTDGEVQFVHDGGEVAPAYSISVSDGSLSTIAAAATITFTNVNDVPLLSTNTLSISEGATVVLSATEVSATDIDTDDATLVFTASGISGGQFENNTNAGVAITSFTQQQVTDGEVLFVHDGGEAAPAYSISVSDGSLNTAAAGATITFTNVNDGPTLSTNTLNISEGATVVLSATEVSATDIDTDDATLVFTASGISGGQFEVNTNAGVAITSFTQQQVTDGEVQFVHDGGEAAPAYSISVSDGSLSTIAAAATITFTNVNDVPSLSTNTLNISEGVTVVLSATEVSATDIDTDDATLVFTASGISGGQFEVNTNAGVAITSFTQQQVTDGEVQFVHDGGEAAPAYSISVSDGSLSTIAAAATITFTNVNDVPLLSTNTLSISEGATVVLSATEVSATDIDTDDATLVFTASGISGGQFENNTNAGVAITSFTQQQVTDGEVQFVHDGGEVAPAYSISVSDGSLSTAAAAATITFTNVNDVPLLSTNTLSISEGATVVLSATELSATDVDNTDSLLTFTASGVSGGQFENNTNAGVAITSFTQQQVTDGEVLFVHDGGEAAPAYSISVSDGSLSTAAAGATITFTNVNDGPTLSTNTLNISEGATVVLSATEVSATDIDTDDATLVFTASGISGGQFEVNTNAGVAITSFTQQQVTDGEVQFVHDGGEAAPAYSISVSDGSLSTIAAAATITFTNVNDVPLLSTNTLSISEGATVVLSATEVSATDIDTDDATLVFTASNISGGQFENNTNAGVAITSFTQQQVTDGEVQFVHDGGEAAPAYSISVSDGSLSTIAAAATITFTNVNDVPSLSTNTLNISEGATVVLSATEVSATDIDTDDATLVFTASGISGGQFEVNTNAGVAITSFTQQQVTDGEVQFVHDGGEAAPAYSISVSDGSLSTIAAAATITFTNVNDVPSLSTNTLNISEGATVVLSATEVSATDIDTDDATLVFTASNISGGQFENNTNAGVAITSFTQQQVTNGEVQFVHDGGEAAPAYSISVSDGSLSTIAAAATITFTNVNDVPSLSTNTLNISEGVTVVLSATEVSATDIDTDDATLVFTASGISGGQFENNTNAGVAITSFTQQQVTDGEVQFVHDGGEVAPAYSISVSDGSLSTAAAGATITFTNVNDGPMVTTDTGAMVYTENAGAVTVSSGLAVSDADSTNLNGAVVQITGNYVNGEDQLAFATLGAISGSFVSGTGILTLTGIATVVQYEAVLRTITYENTSENPTVGTRTVSVTVNNGAGANNLSNTATRDITVSAVNDAPTVTNLNAAENYTEDTVLDLTDIVVSDVDSASVIVTLMLSDTEAGTLNTGTSNAVTSTFAGGVWSASGALADVNTLLAGVMFTPATNYNSNFSIATSVDDGVGSTLTGSKAFTGTAVNDAPIIVSNGGSESASLAVNENQTAVTTVVATDLDAGSMLTYSLAGADAIAFNIDQSSGILTFELAPDYEIKNTYMVDVIAADNGFVPLTDTQRVTITVIDINEAPVITNNGGGNTVTIPVDENQTAVTTVQAIDQDADTTLAYSLTGTDATAFSIDSKNGLLTFNSAPDYETKNTYHLEIVVSDNGINSLTDSQNLTVTVLDVDDDLRVADDELTTREDTRLLFDPTVMLLANDFDPKGGELGFHSFEQPEHGMLIQNPDGFLEYTPNANFNGLDHFTYTVVDEVGNIATARVSINVEPVNDLPVLVPGPVDGPDVAPTPGVIDANAVSDGEVEVFENSISIVQVAATDVDGDEVSFSLVGPDAGLFEIDVSTGELRPFEPLDFEAPRDVDGDNRYDLEIIVTDGSGALIQIPLILKAVNTNEPPQFIDASFTMEEGFSGELGSLTAIDLDAGDELLFALGATPLQGVSLLPDGRLIADGLEPGTYEIEVLITDSGNLVSVGFVVVNVTALSDTLPSLGAANEVDAETNTPLSPVKVIQGSISYSVTEFSSLSEERAPDAVTFLASPHVVDVQLAEPVFSTSFLLSSVKGVDAARMSLIFIDSLKLSEDVQQDMLLTEEMMTGLPLPPQTLLDLIDQIRASFDEIAEDTEASEKRTAFVVAFGSITLSIGVAVWVLASRVLLAAAFSTAPLWRSIDPIPVLLGGGRDEEDEVVSEENDDENSASDEKASNG